MVRKTKLLKKISTLLLPSLFSISIIKFKKSAILISGPFILFFIKFSLIFQYLYNKVFKIVNTYWQTLYLIFHNIFHHFFSIFIINFKKPSILFGGPFMLLFKNISKIYISKILTINRNLFSTIFFKYS